MEDDKYKENAPKCHGFLITIVLHPPHVKCQAAAAAEASEETSLRPDRDVRHRLMRQKKIRKQQQQQQSAGGGSGNHQLYHTGPGL